MIVNCVVCGKSGNVIPARAKKYKIGYFCSFECQGIYKRNKINTNCLYCGKDFTYHPSRVRKFCSRLCSNSNKKQNNFFKCLVCHKEIYRCKTKQSKRKFCSHTCQSSFLSGENCPSYKHGQAMLLYSGQKVRPQKFHAWSYAVKELDKFTCLMCGKVKNLESHHIYPWSKNKEKRYDLSNGITLCKHCHKFTKRKEYLYSAILTNRIKSTRIF